MEELEQKKLHNCTHCSDRYHASELKNHYKLSHIDHFVEYVLVIVAKRCLKATFDIYDNDDGCIKKVELDKLFESSSPADVLTAHVKRIQVLDDFHYRRFNNVTRECRLCNICECEFRERNELNDHSRDHNKHGGSSYYIETDKFAGGG